MNESLKRKKIWKKELEKKLSSIYPIYDFCKNGDKTQEQVESKFNMTRKDIEDICSKTEISVGTANGVFRIGKENIPKKEEELKQLSKEIRDASWINRLGLKQIFINVVSGLIGFLIGYFIGKL